MPRLNDARGLIESLIWVIAIIIVFALAFMFMPKKGDVIRYDCSISEISPDYPIEVKEKCRKLRAEKL
jgi:hypothetical protein